MHHQITGDSDEASEQRDVPSIFHEIRGTSRPETLAYFGLGALAQVVVFVLLLMMSLLLPQKPAFSGRYVISAFEVVPKDFIPIRADRAIVTQKLPKPFPPPERNTAPRINIPVLQSPIRRLPPAHDTNPNPLNTIAIPAAAPPFSIVSPTVPILRKPPERVQTSLFDSTSANRPIVVGAFGDVSANTTGNAGANNKPTIVPVEILELPKPAYTQEARAQKIEGEVILQVVFLANGAVEIQRVIQTLGYGLEASAETAASEIRFKPASKDGTLVDSVGVVHAKFQLIDAQQMTTQ